MLFSLLCTTLIGLVPSAVAVSAVPGLSVKLTGPNAVDGVENFKVTATITNTGDETLKVLNQPNGPLSNIPAHTFTITNEDGVSPSFSGVYVKYVPEVGAAAGDYTTLSPGQSHIVDHDLSAAYNFTLPGEGTYSVASRSAFLVVDSNGKIIPVQADTIAHTAHVSGKLAVARLTLQRRATFNGCSADQQNAINAAIPVAQQYSDNSLAYLNSHLAESPRYRTWFGPYSDQRHTTVTTHFQLISTSDFTTFTYNCNCPPPYTAAFAFVNPGNFGVITLCNAFWAAPTSGSDSKAGTIVHEASHFQANGGTNDDAYGHDLCEDLATADPNAAVFNADSHEYFAENTPALA